MDILNKRERGKVLLSIGTSLAFESLLGINDNVKLDPNIAKNTKCLWINVKTLFRNIYGSVPRESIDKTSDNDLIYTLIEEIEFIKQICSSDFNYKLVFYCPDYRNIDKINNQVLLRLDNTDLQKTYTKRMTNVLYHVLTRYNGDLSIKDKIINPNDLNRIRIYDNKITDKESLPTLMITHYAYDLTNYYNFGRLSLLETHSGVVKPRSLWHTKYYNGKTLTNMPFRLDLLTLLGDNTLFRNKTPAIRKELIDLSVKKKWSSITTASKIRSDISTETKDPFLKKKILDCIKGL